MVAVGGADQGEVFLVRQGEADARVGQLEDIGEGVIEQLAGDDVRSAHPADMELGLFSRKPRDIVRPRAAGIDQRAPVEGSGRRLHRPQPAFPPRRRDGRVRAHLRAPLRRVERVERHQPGIVHPAVRIFETARDPARQRTARRMAGEIDALRARQAVMRAEMIVKQQAQPQHPARAQMRHPRQHEAQRADDVRGDAPQYLALGQRLAHQGEFVIFEIAQAAMDQLGGSRGGAARQVARFQQQDLRPPAGRVPGDARAVHPAADHDKVEREVERFAHALRLGWSRRNSRPFSLNSTSPSVITAAESIASASGRAVPS